MKKPQNGFTLVEIAIVLLIVGLLLGGVLKGQELIDSAKAKNLAQDLRSIPPNRHALVEDGGRTVLEIDSSASASSLLHPVGKDLAGARRLRWRCRDQTCG